MAGQVTLGGQLTGVPLGQVNLPPFTIVANSANNLSQLSLTLASGFNAITVPSWAVGVIIIPATVNAVAMTLKGVTGDTGLPLSLTAPTMISFPSSPSNFGLTSASLAVTITEVVFF